MTWARIDDRFHSHPKVASLGPYMLACVGLHTLALSWCNDQLTDGAIPTDQVPRLAGDLTLLLPQGQPWELVARLVAVGMWEEMESGYRIHDFLDYNPSKRHVMQLRKTRALAGQAGGRQRASNASSTQQANRQANPNPVPVPVPSTPEKTKTKTGTSASRAVLGNGDFILALKANPAYKALDIDNELAQMDAWLLTPRGRGKQKTRGRIVAWLNRALEDLPLPPSAHEEEPYGLER